MSRLPAALNEEIFAQPVASGMAETPNGLLDGGLE